MMDDSADSQAAEGGTANVNTADHQTSSSSSSNSSGYNSSGSSSSSSSSPRHSSKRIHPLPPLQPIYESEVNSLPQVAFGNAENTNSSVTRKDEDDKVATKNDKSKQKRSPTTRSKRRRRNFNRNMLLPESRGVEDATIDENDESDMTTKQQPQSNARYLGAILLICGIFVLEYTRNVRQAAHSFDSKNKSSGDDRNPRNLKKKPGSIRAATAGGARGGDAFDFTRQEQPGAAKNGATPSFATSLARSLVTFRHHEENGHSIVLPEVYQHLADLKPMPDEEEERPSLQDMVENQGGVRKGPIPFYWHIFRSGGQTAKTIMGQCLGLTLAAEVGGYYNPDLEQQSNHIPLIRAQGGDAVYLNVNTATVEGLEQASRLGLTSRYNPDVVTSPLLYEATDILFGSVERTNDEAQQQPLLPQGQLFALIRHPIDRAISSFYYHRKVGTYGPDAAVLDIEDHIRMDEAETNYLVRSIVHKSTGEVTRDDLAVAKEVLRRKALIGLLDDKEVSLRRFKKYLGWTKLYPHQPHRDAMECETKLLEYGWVNNNRHPYVDEDSETYRLLVDKNALDIELYEYAKFLFEEQGRELGFAN